MELTDKLFHYFESHYMEKYVDEALEHGNGGFRTVTNRRTATRYALAKVLEGLEPSEALEGPVPVSLTLANVKAGDRVRLVVDLTPRGFDLPKGSDADVIEVRATEIVVIFDDDPDSVNRYMLPMHLVKL